MNGWDDIVRLSFVMHYSFCPRRLYLMVREAFWDDNIYTVIGRLFHRNVDEYRFVKRGRIVVCNALYLFSERLGVVGKADVVEFYPTSNGTPLPGYEGRWLPIPVEYKSGRLKGEKSYILQLTGQAILLEEMFDVQVPYGVLFFGKNRQRMKIEFDDSLRREFFNVVKEIRELLDNEFPPLPVFNKRCGKCSFKEFCKPSVIGRKGKVRGHVKKLLNDLDDEGS